MSTEPIEPWDAEAMAADLLDVVHAAPRRRLDRTTPPATPGAYVQFLAAPWLRPTLGVLADGTYPVYVGLASRSLRDRLGRYRRALAGVSAFDVSDLWVTLVPCASRASAAFAEASLIDVLRPAWNGLGYGARVPGARRSQRCSRFDAVFPGRPWSAEPTLVDEAVGRLDLLSTLARLGTDGRRWSPPAPAT